MPWRLAAQWRSSPELACILAGIVRLGFVTDLLSKPIRYGYMNGIAIAVLISQLPKLFGFSIESHGPLRDLWAIIGGIAGRQSELDGSERSGLRRLPLSVFLKAH